MSLADTELLMVSTSLQHPVVPGMGQQLLLPVLPDNPLVGGGSVETTFKEAGLNWL